MKKYNEKSLRNGIIKLQTDGVFDFDRNAILDLLFLSRSRIEKIDTWPEYKSKDSRLYICLTSSEIAIYNIFSKVIEKKILTNSRINCLIFFHDQFLLGSGIRGTIFLFRPHDLHELGSSSKIEYRTVWRMKGVKHNLVVAGYNGWVHPSNAFVMTVRLWQNRHDEIHKYILETKKLVPVDHTGHIFCLTNLKKNENILVTAGGGAHRNCRDFSLRTWNLKTNDLILRFPIFHADGVISLDSYISKEGNEFILSSSRDGTVVTSDLFGNVIFRVHCTDERDLEGVYSILSYQKNRFFFGGMFGSIFFFDYDLVNHTKQINDPNDSTESTLDPVKPKKEKSKNERISKRIDLSMSKKMIEKGSSEHNHRYPEIYYGSQVMDRKELNSKIYALEWVNEERTVFCSCSVAGKVLIHEILDPLIVWKSDRKKRIKFLFFDGFTSKRVSRNINCGNVFRIELLFGSITVGRLFLMIL